MALTRFKGENYGSLISIHYAPSWQFKRFEVLPGGTISPNGIEFYPGYSWQHIYCTQDTMGHRQTQTTDQNGDSWTQQVVGLHPGDEDDTETGLLDLHNKQFYVLMVTRPTGSVKIVGLPTEPLGVSLDSNSQTAVPGRAGTAITFNGKTLKRALILSV